MPFPPPDCADMGTRRALYLAILGMAVVFYIAYGQWLSWILLLAVAGLPWFSLLLSLPAMCQLRASPGGAAVLEMGMEGEFWIMGSCSLPMPPFRGRLRLTRNLDGESWLYQDLSDFSTEHCAGYTLTLEKLRVFDYLGLFSVPLRCREKKLVLVRPKPVPMDLEKEEQRFATKSWRPRAGGGYAENHELRLYRPGDSLNQVHWKLSAKTGNLILREAMEPRQGLILLTLNLRGTREEMDRKLGRLLWLGEHLLGRELRFEIRALTGEGLLTFPVVSAEELKKAVDALLCHSAAESGDFRTKECAASWRCHIGGQADEA